MNGLQDDHTKQSKSEKDKYDITFMWLKKDTDELIYKTEIDSQTWKTILQWPKVKGRVQGKLGIWV